MNQTAALVAVVFVCFSCKSTTSHNSLQDDAVVSQGPTATPGVSIDTAQPVFPPAITGPIDGIRTDLFQQYCANSCHGDNDDAHVFSNGPGDDMRISLARNATLVSRVLDYESAKVDHRLTMPHIDPATGPSTERNELEAAPADRLAMRNSLMPFVAPANSPTDLEDQTDIRRGVSPYGSFNQGELEDAQRVCLQRRNEAVNNLNDYCLTPAKVLHADNSCDPQANCHSDNGLWSCKGTFAWVCERKPIDPP